MPWWIFLPAFCLFSLADPTAPIWGYPDLTTSHHGDRLGRIEAYLPRLWTSPPWWGQPEWGGAGRLGRTCRVTVFAMADRPMRLVFEGQEQLVDTAWHFEVIVPEATTAKYSAVFLEPIGGAIRTSDEVLYECRLAQPPERGELYDAGGLRADQ